MVLVKKSKNFHSFLFGKKSQKNVFDDVLKRENVFLYYKKKEFKNMKNWDISKRVSPWF